MTCKHPHGDTVNGYWLCGKCYAKLPDRPKEYRTVLNPIVKLRSEDVKSTKYRQEVNHAPISTAESGFTLSAFIDAMARKLMAKATMTRPDALDYARDILEMVGEEFGNPDMCWDTEAAWELVKEDMQYWDFDADGGNS